MRSGRARPSFGIGLLMALALSALPALTAAASSTQASTGGDQAHAGKWVGTYASESGSGNVTYVLVKDDKGWSGTVTYTSQNGARSADLKDLQIAGSKFKAKIDSPDGESEITLQGEFGEKDFVGTYIVLEKTSRDVAEKGTWKAARQQNHP